MAMGKGIHPAFRSGSSNPKTKKNPGPDYAQPTIPSSVVDTTGAAFRSPARTGASAGARQMASSILSQKPFNFGKKRS